jgi:hypothetical protein
LQVTLYVFDTCWRCHQWIVVDQLKRDNEQNTLLEDGSSHFDSSFLVYDSCPKKVGNLDPWCWFDFMVLKSLQSCWNFLNYHISSAWFHVLTN